MSAAATTATVRNIKSTDLSPKLDASVIKTLGKMLPNVLTPKRIEFDILGVSVAVANGLRRTCALETTGKSMTFGGDAFLTDDPFILSDFLLTRIQSIPIKQDIDLKAEFYINVTNTSKTNKCVYSSDIKSKRTNKPIFNQTFPVVMLQPNTYLKLTTISIHEGFGYINACFALACQTSCVPLDQTPVNLATEKGVRSGIANPKEHRIGLMINGGLSGKEIVIRGCQSIRERLRYAQTLLPTLTTKDNVSMLVINGESDTIGNLLLKTVIDLNPHAVATYETASTYRALTFKLRTTEEPERIINNAIKYIIEIYTTIEKQIR